MNKNNLIAAAIGTVATTALVATASYAYQGNSSNNANMAGFNDNSTHQAIMEALDNNDYETWKNLMEEQKTKISDFITEDNFNKMVAMHQAMQSGDVQQANDLRDELDLPHFDMGMAMGMHRKGMGNFNDEMMQNHEAIIQAIENNDYETWKNLMGDSPVADKITADNFSQLVESYNLMKEGKFDEARAMRQDLGIGVGMMRGR